MSFAGSLDTNAVLRLLLDDIPEQRQKVVDLLASTNEQFAVADAVFIELIFVLALFYDYSRPAIVETVQNFASVEQIACNREMLANALANYEAHPSLSFEDCALVAYAELDNAIPLYTFDKKLAGQLDNAQLID